MNRKALLGGVLLGAAATLFGARLLSHSSTDCVQGQKPRCLRVGLLGCGAIGSVVAEAISQGTHGLNTSQITIAAVLVSTPRTQRPAFLSADTLLTTDSKQFWNQSFDVCVEAAGQGAVRAYANQCLQLGRDFLITSIGALADDSLFSRLQSTSASVGAGRLMLASGAMPGLDWMHSSSLASITQPGEQKVTVIQTKPPESWKGAKFQPGTDTRLPDEHDYDTITEVTTVFEGSAREAGSYFPKNSNICAMLAISTAGLDNTIVRLVADPTTPKMSLVVQYAGSAGKIIFEVEGYKSKSNPRTSVVVPLSVIKALKNLSSNVVIGA